MTEQEYLQSIGSGAYALNGGLGAVQEEDKCARKDRIVPQLGAVYCGCSKCDPE